MGILKSRMLRMARVAPVLLLLAASVPPFSGVSAQGDALRAVIVVVVSAQSKLQDLPKALLKRVFLGEPTEAGGTRLLPFNYAPDDPLRRRFDALLLGFDADAAGRYWVDRRIRGQGLPPRVAPSSVIVRAAVARLPGAISYLYAAQLDASVRALRVDGVPHTAADYPLK